MPTIKQKIFTLSAVGLIFCAFLFSFAVFHVEDGTDKISFVLTDQYGNRITHEDISSKPQLVFFGFTSCVDVCPIGLYKLSSIASELKTFNQEDAFTTVMITVDPERDTKERMRDYLSNFSDKFIGLTGTRIALESVAAEFNTIMQKPPRHVMSVSAGHMHAVHANHSQGNESISANSEELDHAASDHAGSKFIENYQLAHSSVIYLVDTYSQVVEYISLDEDVEVIVQRLRRYLDNSEVSHG